MAGDETVKVALLQAEAGEVIPAAHVLSRRGKAGDLPKDFQEAVVVEIQKAGMILLKLRFHRTVEQLHGRIGEGRQRWSHRNGSLVGRRGPRGKSLGSIGRRGSHPGSL